MPRGGRIAGCAVLIAVLALLPGSSKAQRPRDLSPEGAEAAIEALISILDTERDILRDQIDRYRRLVAERDASTKRLQELQPDYDALVVLLEPAPPDQLAAKEREIADAERRRSSAIDRAREVRGWIQLSQDRIAGMERRLAILRGGMPRPHETLTGNWSIIYLPAGTKGVFVLRQNGTIVQGQYQLEGGWKGSLQGTFVDGKIYLQRIDSKLGRSSELQGYLAPDGRSIKGTWQNYNLTEGAASSGSWTASRQED